MTRKYKFHNPEGLYFVSFAVIEWLDVFTRKEYKNIVLDSLKYCQKEKGLEIISWCIMSNHIHLVFRSVGGKDPSLLLGDFKRFTSKAIIKAIINNPRESRKAWLMEQFSRAGKKTSNVKQYQFWRHDNHPIELWSQKFWNQKINYIHMNPVKEGLVLRAEDYVYSSARDYIGEMGVLGGVIVCRF